MTQSEDKNKQKPQLPTANATILGKNPCLYPLVLPGRTDAALGMQKCQNILFLQNYLASRYLLERNIGNGLGTQGETRVAAISPRAPQKSQHDSKDALKVTNKPLTASKPPSRKMKKSVGREKEEEGQKKQHHKKKAVKKKPKKRPSQLKAKVDTVSRNKRQKTSLTPRDQPAKKHQVRQKKTPRSPIAVTPRRKASNDLLGFVSQSLPVPRDITAEWKNFKKEIITPPWQTKKYDNCVDNEEGSSSEEDISDEKYFKWHTRSYERDCQRIRKVLERPKKNRPSKQMRLTGSKTQSKKCMPPETQALAQPVTYNYDVFAQQWTKPEKYIRFVDTSNPSDEQESAGAAVDTKTKLQKCAKAGKTRKKKKRTVSRDDLRVSLQSSANENDLAEMRLRYLQLQAQLEKLCGKRSQSPSTWKAEKKTGKDGKETNVIRLLRVSKIAA